MAAADAQRFANLVTSGDVSRSAYEKIRTQQETADAQVIASRQQYEGGGRIMHGRATRVISTSQASLTG